MINPLAKVRGLGSAKNGTHHWIVQRMTAVALVPLTLWFVVALLGLEVKDFEAVRAWIGISDPLFSYVGKGTYAPSHDDYDVHATAPTPLPENMRWC